MCRSLLRSLLLGVVGLQIAWTSTGLQQSAWAEAPAATRRSVPGYLAEYIARPEPAFKWTVESQGEVQNSRITQITLISQEWQGIQWKHGLYVYEPSRLQHPEQMILFVSGGNTGKPVRSHEQQTAMALAELSGARVALLLHVPNQPLFEDRREDDLISETWLRYLETGDASWPLLFPMVKSAVKAMDALQEFTREKYQQDVKGFVITGASKRGWTSWLTPAADSRVIGTAPMVIDVLNFSAQMRHQKQTWGFFSEQIADYTSKGLVHEDGTEKDGRHGELWRMMDPYTYRNQVSIPKLMIVGANDRYWTTDAMNLYWDDLPGQKYVCRIANAGHNLDNGQLSQSFVVQTISVFFKSVVSNKELPQVEWTPLHEKEGLGLRITCSARPTQVRLWSTTSSSRDFRDSKWVSTTLPEKDGAFTGIKISNPGEHQAIYGEVIFNENGIPYGLSTLVYQR